MLASVLGYFLLPLVLARFALLGCEAALAIPGGFGFVGEGFGVETQAYVGLGCGDPRLNDLVYDLVDSAVPPGPRCG